MSSDMWIVIDEWWIFPFLTPIFEESSVEFKGLKFESLGHIIGVKRSQSKETNVTIFSEALSSYIYIYLYISDKHHDLTNPMPRHAPTTWPPSSSILLDWKLGSDRHVHDTKYGYKIMCLPCITITLLEPPPPLLMVACFGYKRAWSENEFYQN